ncbi:3-deoxy-D-manno-octulosonic acid transferase [Neolewinella persica]|uniref:3-deoxy-D-manno-octulosonic acid transferase n=1 Tax=Neolewinella persica TaxID=70998 RepID=UPI00037D40BC|nr:glycosyltransferase N-terminal domain-containing protein [Neolewinella persica]
MQTFLYYLAISAYHLAIRLAAVLGVKQAKLWVGGRQDPASANLPLHLRPRQRKHPLLWMHCASLGEWEQGQPVLEALRQQLPEHKILLTFFSPSGYVRCKDSDAADFVGYLPADGPGRASKWVDDIQPDLAIFVKYEFWFFHLRALHRANIPTFLVAASFRIDQPFFRPWGGWWRKMLRFFSAIAVQTPNDQKLLSKRGNYPKNSIVVAGDPRMDRTRQLAQSSFSDPILESFTKASGVTIIAGSVWPPDVDLWKAVWKKLPDNCRLLLAPHQLHEEEIAEWSAAFNALRYTHTNAAAALNSKVLILDTIGVLSRAYRYGDLAYIGGAFKTGLHNTLEPMAYGLPAMFGPKHHKFPEAGAAMQLGGAFTVQTPEELLRVLELLLNTESRKSASGAQMQLSDQLAGAGARTSSTIMKLISLGSR